MNKTIMILVIAAAFVAGTISTATFVSAAPPENNPGKPFDAILEKLDEIIATITGTDAEVTNIEGKLDGTVPSLVTDIKTETDKIQMVKDDVGMIKTTVGGIDTEVTNIEAKLDNPTTGLGAIKTGIDNIGTGGIPASTQTQIDNIESDVGMIKTETNKIQMVKDNQYIPFRAQGSTSFSETCDVPDAASTLTIKSFTITSGSSSPFILTSIHMFFPSVGSGDSDSLQIVLRSDGQGVASSQNLSHSGKNIRSFEVLKLESDSVFGGTFPHQVSANSFVRLDIICNAGTSGSDIVFNPSSFVFGWKQATDIITVTP